MQDDQLPSAQADDRPLDAGVVSELPTGERLVLGQFRIPRGVIKIGRNALHGAFEGRRKGIALLVRAATRGIGVGGVDAPLCR